MPSIIPEASYECQIMKVPFVLATTVMLTSLASTHSQNVFYLEEKRGKIPERGECDAVERAKNHEEGGSVALYLPAHTYECGLSSKIHRGYRFCIACSKRSKCPICGLDRDDSHW